ncbi:MAG TPA: permease-like cell division protein FtsX [Chitinophagaceae bacterium]|nr:permease-like cell division protein FtsX [Chitinophagaceae bacterium]
MPQPGKLSARRSKPSYVMAIIGVAFVLLILGVLGWLLINAKQLVQHFRERVEVQVYLKETITSADSAGLVQYIGAQPYVKSFEYVTKEAAKQKYLEDGNQSWAGILDKNPLPASINFRINNQYAHADSLKKIQAELTQNIAVSDVKYPESLVANLNNFIKELTIVLLVIAIIICVAVIILIDNTIRLAMFSNRFLIKTMQMVGATRWFIARPMNIRAIINGAISGLIAIVGIMAIIFFAEKWIPEIKALRDFGSLGIMFVLIILIGISISLASTHRSVIKYLKMKLDDLY